MQWCRNKAGRPVSAAYISDDPVQAYVNTQTASSSSLPSSPRPARRDRKHTSQHASATAAADLGMLLHEPARRDTPA